MFRWKRAVLHALIPFALTIAAGFALFAVTNPIDPEQAGEGVGKLAFVMACAGFAISWLAQTGRKKAASGLTIAIVGLMAAMVVALVIAPAPRHASSRDRAPLVQANGRLTHPTLGFSIAQPPAGFKLSPALAAAMGDQGRDTVIYAYGDDPPQAGLIVSVLYGVGGSRTAFEDAIAGLRRGLEKAGQKIEWIQNTISGDDEAHLHALVAGAHLKLVAYDLHEALVTVMTLSKDGTALEDILGSFRRPAK